MSADKEVEMKSPAESDDDNMSVQESDDDYPVRAHVGGLHCGTKPGRFETANHPLECVSEASSAEQANE